MFRSREWYYYYYYCHHHHHHHHHYTFALVPYFIVFFSSSTQSPNLHFRHCHRRLPHNYFTNTSVLFFLALCKFESFRLSQ